MSEFVQHDKAKSLEFFKSVALSAPEAQLEAINEAQLPTYDGDVQQAITVGSQISEYAKAVPVELRPYIDNSFLLAQFAANAWIDEHGGGTQEWYDKYLEVLSQTGWIFESTGTAFKEVTGTALDVHKEIIPIVAAALGPAVAAASIVVATLNGLANIDKNKAWITLFDRASQRASANQFQLSYVDVHDDRLPLLTLSAFELKASASVTHVLFFKFSTASARLSHVETKVKLNQEHFDAVKDTIASRLRDRSRGYITDLKI